MTTQRHCRWTLWLRVVLLLAVAALLVGCDIAQTTPPCPEVECPECPEVAAPEPVAYQDLWNSSGHADEKAEAFTHWNEDDPPEIPIECAKCHSRPGFLDFLGVDGTEASMVDNPTNVGTTITCFVCHNEAIPDMDRVVFPSGSKISGLGAEARCIQCHHGLASSETVSDAIAEAGLTDDDTPSEDLAFVNSHSISAATPYGTLVQGAYEYDGMSYRGLFNRGDDFLSCIDCHETHSLELQLEYCRGCHTGVGEDARDIRVDTTDYDGDGDLEEGIAGEVETIYAALYAAMQAYANDVAGKGIVFDPESYPYFFVDVDGDGDSDPEETIFPNQYNAWTPRLLRAAYNLNYVAHDPGAFAHNSDYVIQVMYDSLVDLAGDVAGMSRPEVPASTAP